MLVTTTYHCPRCKGRLTRVAKWFGYCCERCQLAVTMLGNDRVRVTPVRGTDIQVLPLSDLSA